MDLIKKNTDYGFRAVVALAAGYGKESVSTKLLAEQSDISYQFAAKILQKLHNSGLIASSMGPRGGFVLAREPAKISLRDVLESLQGPVSINKCLLGHDKCRRQPSCPVSRKLEQLQGYVEQFLGNATIQELLDVDEERNKSGRRRGGKK